MAVRSTMGMRLLILDPADPNGARWDRRRDERGDGPGVRQG